MTYCNVGDTYGANFHICEADFPLRPGWFYHEKERGKTKKAAYLMQRYLSTVGNGGTMNLGIAPNKEGLLDEEDVRALRGFGDLQKIFRAREGEEMCNVVVMQEDVSEGEKVDDWTILSDGRTLASGRSIGIKRIRVFDAPVRAKSLRLETFSGVGAPQNARVTMKTYFVEPELLKIVQTATTESGETDTARWMTAVKD